MSNTRPREFAYTAPIAQGFRDGAEPRRGCSSAWVLASALFARRVCAALGRVHPFLAAAALALGGTTGCAGALSYDPPAVVAPTATTLRVLVPRDLPADVYTAARLAVAEWGTVLAAAGVDVYAVSSEPADLRVHMGDEARSWEGAYVSYLGARDVYVNAGVLRMAREDMRRAIAHELAHCLGVPHAEPTLPGGSLMAPTTKRQASCVDEDTARAAAHLLGADPRGVARCR
jgi:hypothetical protein